MKHAGHGFTHTEIEIHNDGSATMEHHHEKGADFNKRYSKPDLDGIHDGLEENLRVDPDKEDEDEEKAEEEIHPGIHEQVEKIAKGE
ncbi:MAG TPA: hypothetical protein VN843_13960 [Anaerolineales bacterium]|nr:hypothetical protein [Anaerolineales bacterium]